MKEKMYYVLVSEWNLTDASGDSGVLVRMFDDLDYAKEQMKQDAEEWIENYSDDEWDTRDISEMSIVLYETHAYTFNHIWGRYKK